MVQYGSHARLRLLTAVDDVGEVVGGGVDAHRGPLVVSDPLQPETLLRVLPQETPVGRGRKVQFDNIY